MKLEDLRLERLQQATQIYLNIAYEDASIPSKVTALANFGFSESGKSWLDDERFEIETRFGQVHYFLRLGNVNYPHMKLAILECSGIEGEYIFSVDNHDRHFVVEKNTPDIEAFEEVQRNNLRLKKEIESAWANYNIPTEATFLAIENMATQRLKNETSILVVDDSPSTLILESKILKNAGYQVTSCECGADALKAAEEAHFDICMIDLAMPEINAFETIQAMRKTGKNAFPILIASAASEKQVKQAGSDDFIPKPFSPSYLLKKINELLLKQVV